MAEFLETIDTGSLTDEQMGMLSALSRAEDEAKAQIMKDIQQHAIQQVKEWQNQVVRIGMIGDPGTGKSTFINSFRGLKSKERDAAETGVEHTTTVVTEYPHPKRPENLILVDFPGVLLKMGEDPNKPFDIKQYLDNYRSKMELCDVFLVFNSGRIQHNAIHIGMKAKEMGKEILFVRSKFDDDLRNKDEDDPDYFKQNTEEDLREKLRRGYIKVLKEVGWKEDVKPHEVFIISGRLSAVEQGSFDIPKLRKALVDDLIGLKKMVIINTCRDYSKGMVQAKGDVYRSNVWKIAFAVTAASFVPVYGSMSVPVAWKMAYEEYMEGFGLQDDSLEHLAKMTAKDPDDLKDFVSSRIMQGKPSDNDKVKGAFGFALSTGVLTAMAVDQTADYLLPAIGAVITAPVSFGITHNVLNTLITNLEECAKELFDYAFKETAV